LTTSRFSSNSNSEESDVESLNHSTSQPSSPCIAEESEPDNECYIQTDNVEFEPTSPFQETSHESPVLSPSNSLKSICSENEEFEDDNYVVKSSKKWSLIEMNLLKNLFDDNLKNKILPTRKEIAKAIRTKPIINQRAVTTILAKLKMMLKYK
jgi:hypothetical protein